MYAQKKFKVNSVSKQNVGNIDFFHNNNCNVCQSSITLDNQVSSIFDFSLLNQQMEFNNSIKNTIKIKYNLAEIDLLKILHDLQRPISVYDSIMGWATCWSSNKVIFDSSLDYKYKRRGQLLKDLATRCNMTNTGSISIACNIK